MSTSRFSCVLSIALSLPSAVHAAAGEFDPPIAITHVRLVQPGSEVADATIVIERGRFVAAAPDARIPDGAEVLDGTGLIAYPGFIDAASAKGVVAEEPSAEQRRLYEDEPDDPTEGPLPRSSEAYRRLIHPHWRIAELYNPAKADLDAHRKSGFTAALVVPQRAILAGRSALLQLGDAPRRRALLRADVAMHAELYAGGFGDGYPTTVAGGLALFRQTMLDVRWYADVCTWVAANPARTPRVPLDADLGVLQQVRSRELPIAFEANSENGIHRALNVAQEFGLRPMIVGGSQAWKVAARLKETATPLIVSLELPEEPKTPPGSMGVPPVRTSPATQPTGTPLLDEDWHKQPFEPKRINDERKRLWEETADNLRVLQREGVPFALCTRGVKSPRDAMENLRKTIDRGLPREAALEALTTRAAEMLGEHDRLGRVAPGYLANLVVMTGPLGDKDAKVRWAFVEGEKFELDAKAKTPSSAPSTATAPATSSAPATASAPAAPSAPATAPSTASAPATATSSAPATQPDKYPAWASEIESDRKPEIQTGGTVLLRNATVLTVTNGDITGCDILIDKGVVAAIGPNLAGREGEAPAEPIPPETTVIDLTGFFVCPGIIDCHSHMGLSGGINEASQSVTPEVRMADVVNHEDVGLYRALAGGVTMIHTMHGSANTIGGQNVVLRLKWGRPAAELIVSEAPQTVKFALGENPKRSNSGQRGRTRFPASRMGVETVLRRSFEEARRYRDARARSTQAAGARIDAGARIPSRTSDAEAGARIPSRTPAADDLDNTRPLRRDLRLEALCDIMEGDIWVHCHCYRADEMLRLLDVAEAFGFRVGVLQHVLEGYRVIPEIVRHGCAASTFSDWWSYKMEAAEAIPYNAARMAQAGIAATVNSDSGELVRHLNLEAAKSMRFGGLPANDALKLVTLNAAVTLGLREHAGAIETGKWGDLAVFDGHPMDTFAKCVLTLVGGEVCFQHPDFRQSDERMPVRPAPAWPSRKDPLQIAASPSGVYAIRGATLHPVSGPDVSNGLIVFSADGLKWLGAADDSNPGLTQDATMIDAAGLHVYPGLINSATALGLSEIGSVPGTVDTFELGTFQPDVMAASAVNPHSDMIPVARAEGITAALIMTGGGRIPGRASLLQLDGWTMPEMILDGVAPLMLRLPYLPAGLEGEERGRQLESHDKEWRNLEAFFRSARRYADVAAPGRAPPSWFKETDDRFEAMRPYVTGEAPLIVSANQVKAILEAIKFAERYELKLIIHGGREAWKVADLLAERDIPVIIDEPMNIPGGEFEPWDSVYRNAGILDRAGVRICFGGGDATLAKQVATNAGMAIAHGLDEHRAIRALTLGAAEILGVADITGSLDTGKRADLIVTNANPCQASSNVLAVFINGRPADLETKHTRNDTRFRTRPPPKLPPPRSDLKGPAAIRM